MNSSFHFFHFAIEENDSERLSELPEGEQQLPSSRVNTAPTFPSSWATLPLAFMSEMMQLPESEIH